MLIDDSRDAFEGFGSLSCMRRALEIVYELFALVPAQKLTEDCYIFCGLPTFNSSKLGHEFLTQRLRRQCVKARSYRHDSEQVLI